MCAAEVARGFEPPLNGGNPGRQVKTSTTVIVLLAAVGLLAVLSPLVVAASPASAASETITVTTPFDGGAMGGESIGFDATGFPPNSLFPYQITDNETGPSYTCTGNLATDANGNASINDACNVSFSNDETVTVTYDGVTVTVPPPPQPPVPTVATVAVSPPTATLGDSVTYSADVSSAIGVPPSGTVAFTDGSVTLCTT
jgi:hypothetical protein